MEWIANLDYPENEQALNEELRNLFQSWHEEAAKISFPQGQSADHMIFDGFYPYYTHQKVRVLFIAREGTGLHGRNYIETVYGAYKEHRVGNLHLNQYKFHAFMFKLAYAMNHNLPNAASIPRPSDLADEFATESGLSFAFMNLSKLSSETGDAYLNKQLFESFVSVFAREPSALIQDELGILSPDIIITMNLLDNWWKPQGLEVVEYGEKASAYRLPIKNKVVPLIDMFHFSAGSKAFDPNFLVPLRHLVRTHGLV